MGPFLCLCIYNVFLYFLQGEVWRGRGVFSMGCQRLSPEETEVIGASPQWSHWIIWFLGWVPLAVGLLNLVQNFNL